ncbi:MAG: DUF1697 domain-containing protein [Acidobacteriota bacterium]|nr:DUF1697 domain-containing protein [Acidobacteriota bacterium]
MNTWIALLRGVNVLGHGKLPMAELVEVLEKIGLKDVRTYIQSGNVVFRSPGKTAPPLCRKIGKAILASHGFAPHVLVLSVEALRDAVARNPFPSADGNPKSVHLFFLDQPPMEAKLDRIGATKADSEEFALTESVFYLHTPDGFGPSKLAANAERLLGVPATARNWRTVNKILEMAEGPSRP